MSTETVLSRAQVDSALDSIDCLFWDVSAGATEKFARAIEQAVLQSPGVKRMREDAGRFNEAVDLLKTLFSLWENGAACYSNAARDDYIGNAFQLDDKTFRACVDLLTNPHQLDAAMEKQP